MIKQAAILVVLGLVTAVAVLSGAGSSQAQTATFWAQIDLGLPATTTLTGVYMVDGTNGAWVVGADGTAGLALRLQRQAGSWTVQSRTGFRAPLRAIAVIGDDNVWAVGDAGLIVHHDSNGWHEVPNPAPTGDLTTIQMFGQGEEGWAGGTMPGPQPTSPLMPVLLHYHDGQWQRDSSISSGEIHSLHFVGDYGWAAGYESINGAEHIWSYNNGVWHTDSIPPAGQCVGFYGPLTAVRTINQGKRGR